MLVRRHDAGVVVSTRELTRSVAGYEPLDVAIRWPTEGSFDYRAYSRISIRTLAVSDPWNPMLRSSRSEYIGGVSSHGYFRPPKSQGYEPSRGSAHAGC